MAKLTNPQLRVLGELRDAGRPVHAECFTPAEHRVVDRLVAMKLATRTLFEARITEAGRAALRPATPSHPEGRGARDGDRNRSGS